MCIMMFAHSDSDSDSESGSVSARRGVGCHWQPRRLSAVGTPTGSQTLMKLEPKTLLNSQWHAGGSRPRLVLPPGQPDSELASRILIIDVRGPTQW